MSLQLSDLVAERSIRPRRKRRGRRKGLVAGGAIAAIVSAAAVSLAVFSVDGPASAVRAANPTDEQVARGAAALLTADDVGPASVDVAAEEATKEAPRYNLPADERALLAAYPGEPTLDGLEMLASGDVDGAEDWIGNYLAAPTDGRDDQAALALAVVYLAKNDARSAEGTLANLVGQRPDSNRSGDGYYLLGKIRSADGRLDEAEEAFLEAVRVYEKSHGGRRAAKRLADDLYEKYVEGYRKRTEWERIRDLYSIAIRGLVSPGSARELPPDWDRGRIISRLDELNSWVVSTSHARPKEGYPTNITFHTVSRGDTLGEVAQRYGVTVGSIKRLNGVPPESHVIRPGQELKILRGRTEVYVDARELVMTVWIDKKFLRQYPVGIGREGRTPVGSFKIASRQVDPDWRSIPFGDPRNILGTRWLGFERSGAGRGIGIHGSRLAEEIWEGVGERVSEGCIRMRNPEVEELYDFVPLGTEVVIYE